MDRRRKRKTDGFGRTEDAISGNRKDDGQVISVHQVTGFDFKEKEMTVSELIEALKEMPREMESERL